MNILITGSSGYLGKLLVNHFLSSGHKVTGIDTNENPCLITAENFIFHRACITNRQRMEEIFSAVRPDTVIHLACTFNKVRNRRRECEIDLGGSAIIASLCGETPSVKMLIYSSSAAIYGGARRERLWLREGDSLNPGKYRYGRNKKEIEKILLTARTRSDLHVVSLRICTVVGPAFAKPGSVVSLLLLLPWFPRSMKGNIVQFLHEDDFVRLMENVVNDREIDGIYNLSPDTCSVIEELAPEKKYILFPVRLIKPVLWLLWHLRLMNLQPSGIKYATNPIILDPARIVKRFHYHFGFSSSEAFLSTKLRNSLPEGARF